MAETVENANIEPIEKVAAEYDHRDHQSAYCPTERWARLRKEAPIARSEKYGGFYVLSRYDDIFEAARDPATFASGINQVNIPALPTANKPPIDFDPPEHTAYRTIVNPFFAPEKVAEYTPWIREISDRHTEQLLQQDSFDVVTDLTFHVTHAVTVRALGITDPHPELRKWAEDLSLQVGDVRAAAENMYAYLSAEVDKRRKSPAEDVITALINSKFQDVRLLTHEEIVNTTLLLALGGLETTVSATSSAVWHLVQYPEDQQRLIAADERLWRLALDEFVRWASPLPSIARTVRHDTEFKRCPMRAGERILMLWGSGNRDEAAFDQPNEVILDRFPNRHLGFGMGPHRCIGSHLAKAMLRTMLSGLLKGLHNFRLVPEGVVWAASEVRGMKHLPLVRK
jgi:cytochrome P450